MIMQYTVLSHHYSDGNYEAVAPAVPGCTPQKKFDNSICKK